MVSVAGSLGLVARTLDADNDKPFTNTVLSAGVSLPFYTLIITSDLAAHGLTEPSAGVLLISMGNLRW